MSETKVHVSKALIHNTHQPQALHTPVCGTWRPLYVKYKGRYLTYSQRYRPYFEADLESEVDVDEEPNSLEFNSVEDTALQWHIKNVGPTTSFDFHRTLYDSRDPHLVRFPSHYRSVNCRRCMSAIIQRRSWVRGDSWEGMTGRHSFAGFSHLQFFGGHGKTICKRWIVDLKSALENPNWRLSNHLREAGESNYYDVKVISSHRVSPFSLCDSISIHNRTLERLRADGPSLVLHSDYSFQDILKSVTCQRCRGILTRSIQAMAISLKTKGIVHIPSYSDCALLQSSIQTQFLQSFNAALQELFQRFNVSANIEFETNDDPSSNILRVAGYLRDHLTDKQAESLFEEWNTNKQLLSNETPLSNLL